MPVQDETTMGAPNPAPTIPWLSDADSYRILASLLLEPASPEEVCERLVELSEQATRVASCSIFLLDESREYLYLAASNNPHLQAYLGQPTYRVGEGLTGWVFRYRRPLLVRDPSDPAECARLGDPVREIPAPQPGGVPFSEGAHDGWLAAPITDMDGRDCIGVLRVQPRVAWIELTQTDLDRLQVIARLAYLVAQNARLREQQLEDAESEALRTLTAKVAHSVGNKLYALGNLIQALQLSLPAGASSSLVLIDAMRETLEASRELVRNLVTQTSLPPLARRSSRLREVLGFTADCCVPCQFRPEVVIEPGAEEIVCDPDQLRTALGEIVQNCVEINGSGVQVRLEARMQRGHVLISISDNGPGVPEELKGRIFEPLVSTRPGGTGWGLVIAREIVEKHGGSIAEEGVPGQGARFVIRLPKGTTDGLSPAGSG